MQDDNWLDNNPEAKASVERGLEQARDMEFVPDPTVCDTSEAVQAVLRKFLDEHPDYAEIEWKDGWMRVRIVGEMGFKDIKEVWPRSVKDPLVRLEHDLFAAEHAGCTCRTLDQKLSNHPPSKYFHPNAFYNAAGDQLDVYWENESAHTVDLKGRHGYSVMSLDRAFEDNRPVGMSVFGIRKLLEEAGFRLVPIEEEK